MLVCCLLLLFSVLYNWVFSTISLILTFERESQVDTNFSIYLVTTATAEPCLLPISLRWYFFFLIQRSLHTISPLRTRCVKTHRRFTLYACQFLNERELAVLPLKHSYFLLCIKAVLCLRGKSHSFCTVKSSCILQREWVLESFSFALKQFSCNREAKVVKQKLCSHDCLYLLLV